MPLVINQGIHFRDPWLFAPYHAAATSIQVIDSGNTFRTSATTAYFTEMARRGLQDTTNWTANTYKTILSVSSGTGLVAGYIGCTAGGAETHTVEITVDGVLKELIISGMASGERAMLLAAGAPMVDFFTTTSGVSTYGWASPSTEALDSNKQIFGAVGTVANDVSFPTWSTLQFQAVPLLRFNRSLLIRAKHSANITNSTATAYSAVMYRLGL